MPRFLTKIELLDAKPEEKPFLMKVLEAKNIDTLKSSIVPKLPEVVGREFRVLNQNIRILDEDNEPITSHVSMIGYA